MEQLKVISHTQEEYTDVTDTGMRFRAHRDKKTEKIITGETLEDCFRKVERINNSLRYCNGYYLEIPEKDMNKKFSDWYKSLSKSEQMDLYYGGGIVD